MQFKALESPKQMITFEGAMYKAANGILSTTDEKLIEFLSKNKGFEAIKEKEDKPESDKEIKDVKKKTKGK